MKIKLLDTITIQQIAAGEVVERPSSIVKELVENALDATADRIVVEIEQGGIKRIDVEDNGVGIASEDIPMAFTRHSTSKISEFDDLYQLTTMGFRGEALASIVAVSKVQLLTRDVEAPLGTQVTYHYGKQSGEEKPISMNPGTKFTITDLFGAVPVRKKFLKSPLAEANRITSLMYGFAIGNPGIGLKYVKDGKVIFNTKTNSDLKTNLYHLFGKDYYDTILSLNYQSDDVSMKGFLSGNTYYRGNRGMQYLYVNGRYVENDEIVKIIEDAYRGIIPNGRYPAFQIFLSIRPDAVDVNIHPNKLKIAFTEPDRINDLLRAEITDLVIRGQKIPTIEKKEKEEPLTLQSLQKTNEEAYQNILDLYSPVERSPVSIEKKDVNKQREMSIALEESMAVCDEIIDFSFIDDGCGEDLKEEETQNRSIAFDIDRLTYLGNLFATYLVYENSFDKKLVIIDQHAAHERILYETYLTQFYNDEVAIQPLLSPQIFTLKEYEIRYIADHQETLYKAGYEIEPFGDNTVAVRAVPYVLGVPVGGEGLLEIIDNVLIQLSTPKDLTVDKIIMASCKSAVKAGYRLSPAEAQGLLSDLSRTSQPYTCPHGRPILVEWTKLELEKFFLRVK